MGIGSDGFCAMTGFVVRVAHRMNKKIDPKPVRFRIDFFWLAGAVALLKRVNLFMIALIKAYKQCCVECDLKR